MSWPLTFWRGVQAEIQRAHRWYQKQRPGLGDEFLGELEIVLERLKNRPESLAVIHRDVRIAAVDRFPYGVYFRLAPHEIRVLAVLHLQRNPALWQRRR